MGAGAEREDAELDVVFRALADPTRRMILDVVRDGPRSTTEVVEAVCPRAGASRFAVMKHLRVLAEADLVRRVEGAGGRVEHALNAVPIQRVYERWVGRFAGCWAGWMVGVGEEIEGA